MTLILIGLRQQVTQMKEEASTVNALSNRLSSLEAIIKNALVNSETKTALAKELIKTGIFRPNT